MLPLYEEIIRSGAWWDLVDGVSHRLCGLLQSHREDMSIVLRRWSTTRTSGSGGRPSRRSWAPNPTRICPARGRHRTQPRRPRVLYPEGDRLPLRDYAATDPDWVRPRGAARRGAEPALPPALRKLRCNRAGGDRFLGLAEEQLGLGSRKIK